MPGRRTPHELEALVLTGVAQAPRPVTAHELVARLSNAHEHLAPQQAYRTLGRLLASGDVIRIETLNAYRPGLRDGENRDALVFCRRCRASVRAACPGIEAALTSLADSAGFRPARMIVEVAGTCPACQAQARRPA